MSNAQKIIKYLAISFAFFLVFNIISGIMHMVMIISNIFNDKDDYEIMDKIKDLEVSDEVKLLDVDVVSSNIVIKIGDTFRAETSNKYIQCKQDYNMIYIAERRHNWFNDSSKSKLTIYIPEDMVLDGVSINSGAGIVSIDKLSTRILNLDLGAAKVNINNLNTYDNTKINGGSGKVTIKNSSLNNLDLNIGVGKFTLEAKLLGNSKIDHGVGEVSLNLIGGKDDYQIHADKGLGSITISGNEMKDDLIVGNGTNKIDIDGGIGNIDINFIGMN